MEIKHSNFGQKGEFYMEENGIQVSALNYNLSGKDKMTIIHTEVNEAYEGKGLGRQLVQAAVEYARKEKMKIVPLCSYAKKVFEKTPAFGDVLFKG